MPIVIPIAWRKTYHTTTQIGKVDRILLNFCKVFFQSEMPSQKKEKNDKKIINPLFLIFEMLN